MGKIHSFIQQSFTEHPLCPKHYKTLGILIQARVLTFNVFRLVEHSRHGINSNIIKGRISVHTGMLVVDTHTHTHTQIRTVTSLFYTRQHFSPEIFNVREGSGCKSPDLHCSNLSQGNSLPPGRTIPLRVLR